MPVLPTVTLRRLMAREDLSSHETETLFGQLMDGEIAAATQAALLVALAIKGEAVSEIVGAARAMRQRVVPIPHQVPGLVDTCGTGGDGQGSFNISTAAALVAAAAGAPIAKHGNRSVSSRSGSADVLAALGVRLDLSPTALGQALERLGIAFLFAPQLHPAMRAVAAVRRELGVRTIFNLLGPLTNPAGARRQVIGVYARELVPVVAAVLRELGTEHALVVHGSDGLDEITTTGPTWVAEVRDGTVQTLELVPEQLGIPRVAPAALGGGTPAENAVRLRQVLAEAAGPLADVVALNAGAALYVGGQAENVAAGFALAQEALRSGAAERKLAALCAFAG